MTIEELHDPAKKRKAFTALVNQYSEKLYWKVRSIVGRHEDADDVLQNAFLKAWTKIDDFRGDSNIYTWMHRICVNEALDFIRRKRELLSPDGEMKMAERMEADEYFDGNETQRMLQCAIETLPEAQRVAFVMRYFEDLPYSQLSKILNTSEGGLKANYHLAVKKIKEYFEKNCQLPIDNYK